MSQWEVYVADLSELPEGRDLELTIRTLEPGIHKYTYKRAKVRLSKTLDELRVEAVPYQSGTEFRFHVRARSFLHNQVRSFVGTLERVGSGAWTPDDVTAALEARDRAACGPVCPPDGLYLASVGYEEDPFG